jgi:hypothetical protein
MGGAVIGVQAPFRGNSVDTHRARRRPRTAYVSELSLRAGSIRYLRNPVARWGRDLLMP